MQRPRGEFERESFTHEGENNVAFAPGLELIRFRHTLGMQRR